MLVRIHSTFTALIFDHALRIRMKAETSEKQIVQPSLEDGQPQRALQPSGGDNGDSRTVSSQATASASESTAASRISTASTTTVVASESEGSKGADKRSAESKSVEKKDDKKKKDTNLVGKLNNLVTSDLDNILGGRDFLQLGTCDIYLFRRLSHVDCCQPSMPRHCLLCPSGSYIPSSDGGKRIL